MTQADQIRAFAKTTYIDPARKAGQSRVSVRVGDVIDAMGLSNRAPAVSGALGRNKFLQLCNVQRESMTGPISGSNTTFVFRLLQMKQSPP